jgi:hypothetical protein
MQMVLWTRNFLEAQGYVVHDNVVYQDNQSAILLEKNGRRSSGKQTRHIEIRYFFVTDKIKDGKVRVEYCPTEDMTGDFNTKPLQGSKFRKHLKDILNLSNDALIYCNSTASQECVRASGRSYADVVRGTGSGARMLKNDADTSTKIAIRKL